MFRVIPAYINQNAQQSGLPISKNTRNIQNSQGIISNYGQQNEMRSSMANAVNFQTHNFGGKKFWNQKKVYL